LKLLERIRAERTSSSAGVPKRTRRGARNAKPADHANQEVDRSSTWRVRWPRSLCRRLIRATLGTLLSQPFLMHPVGDVERSTKKPIVFAPTKTKHRDHLILAI
jgi:hypothetical protein